MGKCPLDVSKTDDPVMIAKLLTFLVGLKYPMVYLRRTKRIQIEYVPSEGVASIVIVPGDPLTPTFPKTDPLRTA